MKTEKMSRSEAELQEELNRRLAPEKVSAKVVERVEHGTYAADSLYDSLPSFVRVLLVAKPGDASYIRAEVWLPDDWNGVFLGIGNSGLGKKLEIAGMVQYVCKGYAVMHNDLGTSMGAEYGINNPDVWKDYGWRATHVMTVAAKEVLRTYYGEKEKFSYFTGGSSGGRQGLSEAQRFPEDYDGIITFLGVNNRLNVETFRLWKAVHLLTEEGEDLFTKEEGWTLADCATKFFGNEGENFVSVPWKGPDTVERFLDFVAKEHPEFTAEQLDALRTVYNGPVNPKTGERIYCGMPMGSEFFDINPGRNALSMENKYLFSWVFGKDYNFRDFDFADDMDKLHETLAKDLNSNNYDLTPFAEHGGKLLCYYGVSDSTVPYQDAVAYYNHAAEVCGGFEKTAGFFRFFPIPGMSHCGQGNGINRCWGDKNGASLLDVLRRWREEGIAPQTVAGMYLEGREARFVKDIPMYRGDWTEGIDFQECCASRYREN